ncbi:MAG TPA: O-methyltransferase [Gemmatimonadales bacterium]|nr:O-methyltransferase [Gemmatimonadales bacterium]
MTLDPIAPAVTAYLDALVPTRPRELQAMEAEAAHTGFPIIGPAAGHLCYLLTRLMGAHTVFELGSGFGYSTAWFARGVAENGGGRVYHTVWDQALSDRARRHLGALGLDSMVHYHVGEAVGALREAVGPFDIIFNDIDKTGYPDALPVIREKLRPGGLLIADNLLWHGRIFDPEDRSAETLGVKAFTEMVAQDTRWTAAIVPIRDGLLVARLDDRA